VIGLRLLSKWRTAATLVAAVLALPGLAGCTTAALLSANTAVSTPATDTRRVIDDSYTVSQRYEANRPAHPELMQTSIPLEGGARILFNRRYKQIGARELHADLFLPAPSKANGQAVVLIHGGAWMSGDKSNFYTIAARLAARGYAVILPEFRLSPEAGYPAALVDVNDAIDWVRGQAKDLDIDPARIAIGGESSGGQMAALIAYTGGTSQFAGEGGTAARLNALIDLDGVLDFTDPLALRYENANGENSVAARWLGGSMETAPDRWRESSAASHVGASSPPTLIISGEDARFTAGREKVIAALTTHGIPAQHLHFPGLPHTFWLFDPYAQQVVDAIDAFLSRHAAPAQP